jgi:hypothetical protein
MSKPAKVKDAPGLVWKKRANGVYEARWQARTDLVERGFTPKSERMWRDTGEPTEAEWNWISDRCRILQAEMLTWARGGLPNTAAFTGTVRSLIECYQRDPDSSYRKLRYKSRVHYDSLLGLIAKDYGEEQLSMLKARTFLRWHERWSAGGKIAVAHAKIGMLRTMFGFGATILEDPECERLSGVLSHMRFQMPKARTAVLTDEQVVAVRAKAHESGARSIALAQAFQFECIFRQKDVIGEWVPMSEPGMSDVTHKGMKWLRGIRWEEIDQTMMLRHVTSKRQKEIEVNLRTRPMVIEELTASFGFDGDRASLPASGPIVICEQTGVPWQNYNFRRDWRIFATAAGVPTTVRNMDSRAGAISEATDAGADLEHVRHAATHSNISMTQRYSRASSEKTEGVQMKRLAHRNKSRTE